jgi:APA family basic amino acid/polyamine antiporter
MGSGGQSPPAPDAIKMAAGHRPLGAIHAAALVVASMVGTGIFTTTGVLLTSLPSPVVVLAAWAISGVLALCGAAVYAELGAMMPRVGGEYVYVSRAFGPVAGFMSGWVALIVGFAAPTAGGAIGFASYVNAVVPALPPKAVAIALIVAVTALHMTDVRLGGRVQAGLAGMVVAVIVLFVVAALATGRLSATHLVATVPAAPAHGGGIAAAGALAIALVQVSYAYSGWNGAAYVAGEVRDPVRALPRALVLGTGLVTVLYLALNVVYLCAAPPAALAGQINVGHIAAGALFGPRGADVVSSLIALTNAGFVSAMVMSGPRVAVAMGEDGAFFRALGRTNTRGAPSRAVGLQGALAIVAVLTAKYDQLLVYVGFTLTLNAAAAVLAAFVLRRREPGDRPHSALGWPYSGLLFIALATFMIVLAVRERPWESAAALATLIAGGGAYAAWHRRRSRT